MSEEELKIWRATYTSVYSSEYLRLLFAHNAAYVEENKDSITELAISIADEAVVSLRDWRVRGRADAGIQLDKYHLKKG